MSSEAKAPRPGMEFWDKLNALPRYMFLLRPSGTGVQKLEDSTGNRIDVHEAQKVVDEAQGRIGELREELETVKENGRHWFESSNKAIDAMTLVAHQRDALQLRLNAADQRTDELVGLLCAAPRGVPGFAGWLELIDAALKPTESGTSHEQ